MEIFAYKALQGVVWKLLTLVYVSSFYLHFP